MSVYSRALSDNAVYVLPLESSAGAIEGYNLWGSTSTTVTGTLTQVSESYSGGTYSYTIPTSGKIAINNIKPGNISWGGSEQEKDFAIEAVFKKSSASGSEYLFRAAGDIGFSVYFNSDGTIGAGTGGTYTRNTSTASNYCDNKWHHLVVKLTGGTYPTLQIWVDGVLRATNATPPYISLGINFTSLTIGGLNTNTTQGLNGTLDFFAIYTPNHLGANGIVLSDTKIGQHYADFADLYANKTISATALTASSLFRDPAVSAIKNVNFSASVLTASANIGDIQVSNYDNPKTLLTYITSLNPDYYIRFKDNNLENEMGGTPDTWTTIGSPIFKQIGGVSTEPSMILNCPGGPGSPNSGEFRTNSIDGGPSPFNQLLATDDVSFGVWFKTEASDANIFSAYSLDIGNTWQNLPPNNYDLRVNPDGYASIVLGFIGESEDIYESITSTSVINDGEWHFIAFTFDGDVLHLYVDGEEEGSVTGLSTSGGRQDLNTIFIGGQSDNEWASLILGDSSLITSQVASDIWDIGTTNFQAQSYMINPEVKISTSFYDKIDDLGPTLSFKLDGSSIPVSTVNNDYHGLAISSTFNSSNVSYGYPAKNINGYRIQDTVSHWNGLLNAPAGTFTTNNEWSLSALVKVDPTKVGGTGGYYGPNRQFAIIGGNGIGDIAIGYNNDNWIAYAAEQYYLTELTITSTSEIDDKWHLITATFDGTYFKLYVDGVEEASEDTSTYYSETPYQTNDSGTLFIAGGENLWFQMDSTTDVDKVIDHVGIFNYALSAQENFELWQSVSVDPMLVTNATLPLPVGIAGYGPTINPGVMYVSSLLVDPTQQDTVAPTILPITAFATIMHPNYAATKTVTISATALTASADIGNVQWSVGEFNAADHMSASAEFVNPQVFIPGFYNANPMIATNARLVMPAFSSTQGGLVLAEPMRSTAAIVLPPKYKSLFDDKWYDILYSQHSQRHNVRVVNGGNGEAILKLFDDVTSSVSLATPKANRTINNNLTFTITTDGTVVDETAPVMDVIADFNPSSNTPIISAGYFDDYERKAVRINNITTGYEGSEYSNFGFSFEMSIKTTKTDQIIAFGRTRSYYAYGQTTTSLGLSDGKLFLKTTSAIGPASISHYKETTAGNTMIGNKRIDDGQWHHIVVQWGWNDSRIQFWIDGDLDIQRIRGLRLDGPSFLGFNSQTATYASDFYTSAWSYDTHKFILDQEVDNHRYAYIKYEPVRATPMIGSLISGDHLAKGNRARALMLYWWPTDTFQGAPLTPIYDAGALTGDPTFDTSLTTADFIKSGPQEYYGWDIFPVDITGYFVSDLVKSEAYGGKENIIKGSKPFIGTGQNYNTNPEYLRNSQGAFKDPVTDANRYIDLINDIDLRNFDAIFFRNFPDEAKEKDAFTTNEVVDTYFGLRESKLYEDFIKSLRAAVDTGLSLYVTNYQLAVDLGIVDRVETVPDMDELVGFDSDPYSPTIAPGEAANLVIANASQWYDAYKNNRLRIVNELEGFTTEPSFIRTDYIYYRADDSNQFGEPDRPFNRFVYRPDGLRVGDEFIIANDSRGSERNFYATPFANVKAGTIITAFANNVRRGLNLIENPYKDYATTIVVKPGDVLKGTQCGGKIVVNFTENLNGAYDNGDVDLISDYWINVAYNDGFIDEATRDRYLTASYNIDRKLENNLLSQQEYNKLAFWSSNGLYVISDATIIDDPTESRPRDGLGSGVRRELVTKTRKSGTSYTAKVSTSAQWFTFKYSWTYPRMGIKVPNILTRGFWWLSNRESYDGAIQRPVVTIANAIFVNPAVIAQKDKSVNAASMVSSVRIVQPAGTGAASTNYAPLPMTATGIMNNYVTRYLATPMTSAAILRTNNRVFTTNVDEVVVYIYHTDPILYLREDVIK